MLARLSATPHRISDLQQAWTLLLFRQIVDSLYLPFIWYIAAVDFIKHLGHTGSDKRFMPIFTWQLAPLCYIKVIDRFTVYYVLLFRTRQSFSADSTPDVATWGVILSTSYCCHYIHVDIMYKHDVIDIQDLHCSLAVPDCKKQSQASAACSGYSCAHCLSLAVTSSRLSLCANTTSSIIP